MIISFSIYMQFFSKLIPSLLFLSSFSVCTDFCSIWFRSRIDSRILRRARANSYSFSNGKRDDNIPLFLLSILCTRTWYRVGKVGSDKSIRETSREPSKRAVFFLFAFDDNDRALLGGRWSPRLDNNNHRRSV